MGSEITEQQRAKFWTYVSKGGDTACWTWTGAKDEDGYGWARVGHHRKAHRASWALAHGSIPDGLCVCHRCDTPSCVNPSHLFLDTNVGNQRDKVSKGRQARGDAHGVRLHPDLVRRGADHPLYGSTRFRGSGNPRARLSESDVIAIRAAVAAGERKTNLAKRYGVTVTCVCDIVSRKLWKHVA